jgi:hypothetical protein
VGGMPVAGGRHLRALLVARNNRRALSRTPRSVGAAVGRLPRGTAPSCDDRKGAAPGDWAAPRSGPFFRRFPAQGARKARGRCAEGWAAKTKGSGKVIGRLIPHATREENASMGSRIRCVPALKLFIVFLMTRRIIELQTL